MIPQETQHWSIAQLGFQHFEHGRYDDARTLFEGLITMAPDHDYAWRMLGEIAQKHRQTDEAITCFQQSIKHNPEDLGHRTALAQVYLSANLRDEAWSLLSPLRAYCQRPESTWEPGWAAPLQLARALLKAHFQITV